MDVVSASPLLGRMASNCPVSRVSDPLRTSSPWGVADALDASISEYGSWREGDVMVGAELCSGVTPEQASDIAESELDSARTGHSAASSSLSSTDLLYLFTFGVTASFTLICYGTFSPGGGRECLRGVELSMNGKAGPHIFTLDSDLGSVPEVRQKHRAEER